MAKARKAVSKASQPKTRRAGVKKSSAKPRANKAVAGELRAFRDSIDNIDAALVYLLAERFKVTQKVGEFKAAIGLPPADPARERTQIARLRKLAAEARLDPDFSEKFLQFIIHEVIRHHEQAIQARDGGRGGR